MDTIETQDDIVIMATAVADKLDNSIDAPTDAIIAIGQVYVDLPTLHQKLRSSRFRCFRRKSLRVYRARLDWCGAGIDYVELGGHLHVIDAWIDYVDDRSSRKVDCVFDYPSDTDKYVKECSPYEVTPQ
jgi:hypothetical protein